MNLYERIMEDCVLLNKVENSDGEGGFETQWQEGEIIQAAIVQDTSVEARKAEKEGVTSLYTITSKRELNFHDVIKRLSDGEVFRITNDFTAPPRLATFEFRQVTAEKWRLT